MTDSSRDMMEKNGSSEKSSSDLMSKYCQFCENVESFQEGLFALENVTRSSYARHMEALEGSPLEDHIDRIFRLHSFFNINNFFPISHSAYDPLESERFQHEIRFNCNFAISIMSCSSKRTWLCVLLKL